MNILIKLMSIVSLVIAPYIAMSPVQGATDCHSKNVNAACCMGQKNMKCDMNKVMQMTKEECAVYCDSVGCTPEQKAMCIEHAGMGTKKACCQPHEAKKVE
jgi:K(+)-stimulated pyrophosphate-energized sodium pump